MNFSLKQMNKGDLRKCRVCTGQPMATLLCEMCEKNLNLSCFKKESRAPPVCNECLLEEQLEDASSLQELTGEYLSHGEWDTLTGLDDGSGVN